MAERKRAPSREDDGDEVCESEEKKIRTNTCLRLVQKSAIAADHQARKMEQSTGISSNPDPSESMEIFSGRSDKGDGQSLLDRVREIKEKQRKKLGARSQSRFHDAEISMEEFSQNLQSLDAACDSPKPLERQSQSTASLGLVSFRDFQNCSGLEGETLAENQQSVTVLNFDEDNEEADMFEDAKDEPEPANKSDPEICFYGFSSDESQHSKNVAAKCSQLEKLERLSDSDFSDFNGFSAADQKKSQEIVHDWYAWLDNLEPAVGSQLSLERRGKRDSGPTSLESPRIRELKNLEAPKRGVEKKSGNLAVGKIDNTVDSILNQKQINTKEFCGFSTASGRKISLSETAIQRAQKMYKEIEQLDEQGGEILSFEEKRESLEEKIKTASSQEHDLFDESLDEIIGNLIEPDQEIKNESDDRAAKTDRVVVKEEPEENICSGFQTARGGKLKISKEALAKAQAQLEEIKIELADEKLDINAPIKEERLNDQLVEDRDRRISLPDFSQEKSCNKTKNTLRRTFGQPADNKIESGFKTAKGDHLKISKEAFSKARAQFDEIDKEVKENSSPEKHDSACGFSTAGGKPLNISEEALARAKARFDEIDKEVKENLTPKQARIGAEQEKHDSACGFSTAGGKPLNISEEALARAKARFDEIDKEVKENLTPKQARIGAEQEKHNSACGFLTAGGKSLNISEEALARAKARFDEIDEEFCEESTPKNAKMVSEGKKYEFSVGFSTAGGREIKISEEALKKAKNQFQDVEKEFMENLSQTSSKIDGPSSPTEKLASESGNFESLEFEDFVMDESEASKKRKFEEIDDDTPMRKESFWKRKKGRSTSDLQGRKLFDEKLANISIVGQVSEREKDFICEDIDASAAALIEDEECSKNRIVDAESPPEIADAQTSVKKLYETTKPSNSSLDSSPKIAKSNLIGQEKKDSDSYGESIPDDLNFETQFSQDQSHAQVVNKFMMEMMKMMEARASMTAKQDETIRAKRKNKPQACDGLLYRLRTSKRDCRFSWRELTEGEAPAAREHSGSTLDSEIFSVTAKSASSWSFCCADFYGGKNVKIDVEGIKLGDDAFLILDERNCAGAREFERAFLASPGVDPKLVPAGWAKNHYGWIVWKLASMDRVKFGHKCLPRMLTPNRVMLELKYRYDREIDRNQWPPLRRILEKSDDATGRLVLCVASITSEDVNKTPARGSFASSPSILGSTTYKMTLTDGWYCIPASTDTAMINCIKSGKIKEGTKIVTFGATAMNLDQGCSVLEIPDCVTLKIHTNSTRRARWDAKLDFYRANRGPMSLSLKSVKSNGGVICKMVVAISRSYPILYREKLPDGQFVFRNARCDEEAARAHEARCQSKMEEICENVGREFQFCSQSRNQEEEIRRKIAEKLKENLPPPRDVTPVLKVRIADGETSAMLTIWSSNRENDQVFEEGSSIVIYNSYASGQRCNELQITAGRNTIFDSKTSKKIEYPERSYTSLTEIGEAGFNPVYGEFDTVGVVTSTGPAPHGMKNFETVNLACPRSGNDDTSDFLSVLFWQGVSTHGYSKILTVGAPIACSNLEWRRNTPRSIPTAYCTERSIFTRNPRQKHLVKAFESLRETIKDPLAYAEESGRLIEEEIAKKTPLRVAGNGTPYRIGGAYNATTPGSNSRDSIVVPGSSEIASTPKNNSRKASIMRRIEKLEAYGEPPKLPPIAMNNSSPKVFSDFRSPILTPVTKS